MNSGNPQLVDVFPISTSAFGLRSDWFETFAPKLVQPAYLLMALLLVISIGIMVLRRFQDADLEKKVWNIPVIVTVVGFWPLLVLGLKDLIDNLDTFLARDVFQIPWQGFGFPDVGSVTNIVGWSAEGLARLLPNFSYWIIYAFFMVFFFFFAVLGPFVLAKGILFDEIEAFLELLKEVTILFLWQTTVVILVALIMPDIVSGNPFPHNPQSNFYFLSLILGVMILFVPSMTRKFGNHLGSSFFPAGFRWGGALLGLSAIGQIGSMGLAVGGMRSMLGPKWEIWKYRALGVDEFQRRTRRARYIDDLKYEEQANERELHHYQHELHLDQDDEGSDHGDGGQNQNVDSGIDYHGGRSKLVAISGLGRPSRFRAPSGRGRSEKLEAHFKDKEFLDLSKRARTEVQEDKDQ